MQGALVLGRAPVQYHVNNGDLVATPDGRYFAVLSGPSDSSGPPQTLQLVAIDAMTGQVQIRDCPTCESIAPIGGSRVLVNVSDGFLRFDLSTPAPPLKFKPEQKPSGRFHLFSGTKGVALGATRDPDDKSKEAFYSVLADGTSHKIATDDRRETNTIDQAYDHGYVIGRSAATILPTGEVWFAVSSAARQRDFSCAVDGTVSIFSSEGHGKEVASLAPANHAHIIPGVDGSLAALDLWWDNTGDLHAIVLNDTCGADNVGEPEGSMSEWRYHDGRWLQVSTDQTRAVRQLDDRSSVMLRPRVPGVSSNQDYDYYLYLDQGGSEMEIEQGADLLTTAGAFASPSVDPCSINPANCLTRPSDVLRRLYSAPVPSMCGHPTGTLVDGSLPDLSSEQGFVTLSAKANPDGATGTVAVGNVTGGSADEIAAVFDCSVGGVTWPENIVLYSPDLHILGSIDLGKVTPGLYREHYDVERLRIYGGDLLLTWTSYSGGELGLKKWSGKLRWNGHSLVMQDLTQDYNMPAR